MLREGGANGKMHVPKFLGDLARERTTCSPLPESCPITLSDSPSRPWISPIASCGKPVAHVEASDIRYHYTIGVGRNYLCKRTKPYNCLAAHLTESTDRPSLRHSSAWSSCYLNRPTAIEPRHESERDLTTTTKRRQLESAPRPYI